MATIASPSETSLYLNAFDKTIQFEGVMKTIDDDYWTSDIVPILYPLWDSDKDKLELFVQYKDNTVKMNKTKYQRNQKTGAYKWVSYQFDLAPFTTEVNDLYTRIVEKWTEYRVGQENDLEKALAARYAKDNILNWAKLRLIRNFLLLDSDWSQLGDAPLTDAEKAKWVTYRQKLRDVPTDNSEAAEPATVVFPVTPFKHAEMDDGKDYLSDTIEHFYTMNQTVYSRFSSRLVNYLTLTIGTTAIDKMPLSRLTNVGVKAQPTTGDSSLDALLKFIEEGEE